MAGSPPRPHASYTALLGDGDELHLLPHSLYLALATGQAQGADFAGRTMTLLDWHVALDETGTPLEVVGETTTAVSFDAEGRIDWRAPVPPGCRVDAGTPGTAPPAPADAEPGCMPTAAQLDALRAALFGGRWPRPEATVPVAVPRSTAEGRA